jgi:outer membrane protein assembly factor BamE (lipoprotein component of BamABCDE complex)
MRIKSMIFGTGAVLCCLAASAGYCEDGWSTVVASPKIAVISEQKLARVVPGISTKAQIHSLLGAPWRVVQFNDCGMAMPGQADETWDYRGEDSGGMYRLHIEFDDDGVAHLVAKIPEHVPGGKGTAAKISPPESKMAMKM